MISCRRMCLSTYPQNPWTTFISSNQVKIRATLKIVTISSSIKYNIWFFSFVSPIFFFFFSFSSSHFSVLFSFVLLECRQTEDHTQINNADCLCKHKTQLKVKSIDFERRNSTAIVCCVIWNNDQISDDILKCGKRRKNQH